MSTGAGRWNRASSSSADECKVCGEMELKDQKRSELKWVECDICQKWHHIHIAYIILDDKDYEFRKRAKKCNKHIFWLCNDCKEASSSSSSS